MTAAEKEIKKILDGKTEFEPHKFVVKSMAEALGLPEEMEVAPIYVVTSSDGRYGAYGILNHVIQREVQKRLEEVHFYAIPSSIHEFLCVPVSCGTPLDLLEMVKQVNGSDVEEKDQLADAVYYFDGEDLQYAAK